MNYSTKILKIKAKKNIVGVITVKKFDLANSVCKCPRFVKSLLVAPWSLMLAGLILAGSTSKPHNDKKKLKNEGPSENEFHEKTVSINKTKKK